MERKHPIPAARWSRCPATAGWLSLPPKLTLGQIKGFTLYATRTVLSGSGGELIEPAKTNLRELDIE